SLAGWLGAGAVTTSVAEVAGEDCALSQATKAAMWAGIEQVRAGNRLTDSSHAIEQAVRAKAKADRADYGIIAEYGGHGIGSQMHMEPFLPNLGKPGDRKSTRLNSSHVKI